MNFVVDYYVFNRQQTHETFSFPLLPTLIQLTVHVLLIIAVPKWESEPWLGSTAETHEALILTKFLIGYKFVERKGPRQEPINICLIWGTFDRWFINKNMAEKEMNGMQGQFLGESVGLS